MNKTDSERQSYDLLILNIFYWEVYLTLLTADPYLLDP